MRNDWGSLCCGLGSVPTLGDWGLGTGDKHELMETRPESWRGQRRSRENGSREDGGKVCNIIDVDIIYIYIYIYMYMDCLIPRSNQ